MVALNTAYALSKTRTQPKNRVGNFLAGWVIAPGEIGLQPATASGKIGLRLR